MKEMTPLITIFNGRVRALGQGQIPRVYIQVDVLMRKHLHLFSNSEWKVFTVIALHSDQDGWAWPGITTLAREAGIHQNTVKRALAGLCKLRIEGRRVLLRYQPRREGRLIQSKDGGRGGKGRFDSNRYLIFPSAEEISLCENAGVKHLGAATGGGFKTTAEPPTVNNTEPSYQKRTTVKRTTVKPTTVRGTTNHNHIQQKPTDDVVAALLDIGFKPRHEAERYATAHPGLALAWAQAIRGSDFSWVRNRAAYVRKMLDQNIPAPVVFEENVKRDFEPEDYDTAPRVQATEDPALQEASWTWQLVLSELQLQMTRETFNAWLKPTRVVGRENGVLKVETGNELISDWLENRLRGTVERAVASIADKPLRVEFVCNG
jgi:hypothetical protein